MNITNGAKEYIQSLMKEQQAKGLRVYAVEGCCGSQIGLSLDQPEESDTVSVINDIQVAVSTLALGLLSNITLDLETEGNQSDLVLIGGPNNC